MMNLVAGSSEARRHIAKAEFRAAYRAVMPLYARSFFASVVLQALAVMGLVEAIFLAERFPMVFRDVIKNNADLFDTFLIFIGNSTQIFDLALAIAVLMGVYWTALRMRENRELLVLFTAGIGPRKLTALTLIIAFGAMIGSLTVSGVVDPASRYFQRVILFDAEFHALKHGIEAGQFYNFPNRVAFTPPQQTDGIGAEGSKNLFIHEETEPGAFRVITADRAKLEGPDSSGNIRLKLSNFTSHRFEALPMPASAAPLSTGPEPATPVSKGSADGGAEACTDCPGDQQGAMYASDFVREMTIDELLPFPARGTEAAEWTIFDELAAKPDSTLPSHQLQMRLLGERFARGLLCLLAPLIALGAVCLTSRTTNYFALPLACMALMSLNVTSEWLIRTIAPSNPLQAVAVPLALTVVFMAMLFAVIVRNQGGLVRPQLARA